MNINQCATVRDSNGKIWHQLQDLTRKADVCVFAVQNFLILCLSTPFYFPFDHFDISLTFNLMPNGDEMSNVYAFEYKVI